MTTTRTAKFVMSPETPEEIIFPIGDPDETRRHIEIFLTEDLADGEDLDNLTITQTGPYTWQAKYIFDLEWQTLYFVQVAEPAPDLLESLRLALQEQERELADDLAADGEQYSTLVPGQTERTDIKRTCELIAGFATLSEFANFCNLNSWDVESFITFICTNLTPGLPVGSIPAKWDS